MKVLLAGASGAIGTPLTRQLVAHDHQVLGLTRDWDRARRLQALGPTPVVADALDRDGLLRAVDGLAAMRSTEQQAFGAPEGIALRYGLLYGGDAERVGDLLARRRLPVAKGGVLGWVHHDDAAAATVAALERGQPGQADNVVDDLPATWWEVYTTMAKALGAPPPWRLPDWLLRLAARTWPRSWDEGGAMPIPRTVGRWNKVGLNRITRRIAPWLPGFGVVEHRGRRSGRRYRTPVNVFATEGGYRFALTYGPDTDWVKNVLAAGGCELRTRGRTIRLVAPRLYHDERRQGIRPLERQILRLLGVADFLSLRAADQPEAEARSGPPARPSASRRRFVVRVRPRMSRAS